MNDQLITLGIDVSKRLFDAALLANGKFKHRKFQNNRSGHAALVCWLEQRKAGEDVHVCMEATGVYGEALAESLHDHGLRVSIVNPARIKGFAQSEQLRTKTDRVDAGLIARFCALLQPDPWQPPALEVRQLRDLVRRLEALNSMHQQERNRLEAASELIVEQLNEHIAYLKAEIKKVKALIEQHIDDHPDLKRRKTLLQSIPGIGEATISVILSEFADIRQFSSAKALAAFVGLAPRTQQSGTSLRGRARMSKMGRSKLRKAFYMPALVALRHNPIIVDMKKRLTEAGKSKMAIVGAAMRKLIHLIYGVLKNGVPFDEHFA